MPASQEAHTSKETVNKPDFSGSCQIENNLALSTTYMADTDFPDGGKEAWLCVLGGWLSFIATIGLLSGFSVFQSYYESKRLASYSSEDISWIGNIQFWGCFFFGILSGWLSDNYKPRLPLVLGTFFVVLGTMIASISTKYYQYMLSQGLCSAIGLGMSFILSLAIQSQWFLSKRGLAVAIVMSGQNVGGVIWPIIVNRLLNSTSVSLDWTLRIIGFIQLVLMVSATILIRPRFPRGTLHEPLLSSRFFKDGYTMLFTLATFTFFLGLYIPYFYVTPYAMQWGASTSAAFYLSAILNGAGLFGCYVLGVFSDRIFGCFITLTAAAFASGVIAFTWISARNNAAITVWTVFYGFFSGALQALFSPCISSLAPSVGLIGIWNGTCAALAAFAVLAAGPIAGKLLTDTNMTTFVPMQVFTGATLFAASILFILITFLVRKKRVDRFLAT